MPEEVTMEFLYSNNASFYALDADNQRINVIRRYAHILYGNLMRGDLTPSIAVPQNINGVTFIDRIEQIHLQDRIKPAIEYHQEHRTCEQWKPLYDISSIEISAADGHVRVKATTTKKPRA
jgi:hypothetical protein